MHRQRCALLRVDSVRVSRAALVVVASWLLRINDWQAFYCRKVSYILQGPYGAMEARRTSNPRRVEGIRRLHVRIMLWSMWFLFSIAISFFSPQFNASFFRIQFLHTSLGNSRDFIKVPKFLVEHVFRISKVNPYCVFSDGCFQFMLFFCLLRYTNI